MALQTKSFTWGSYDYQSASRSYVLELILTENSVDQSGNTSNISYELLLHSGSNNRFSGQIDSYLKLDGKQVDSGTRQISAQYNSSWTLLQGTTNVAHNDDGSLDMPIEVSIDTYNSYAPPDTTLSWSWALTDIPRESAFGTITGTTLGGTMRVNIQRASSDFSHIVYYYKGNGAWSGGASGATYADIPLPLSLAELSPGSDTFDLRLLLRTYDGDTQIGDDVTAYVSVKIPENGQTKPTVTMELSAVSPVEGLYIQSFSQVQAKLGGSGQFGTSIKSYGLSVGGHSCANSHLSETLNTPGEITVIGSATDSRGFTGKNEQKITVLPYYTPRLPVAEAYRVKVTKTETEDGSELTKIEVADDGEYLKIRATRDYAPIISADGVQHNFCTIKYRYKAEGDAAYSAEVDILAEDAEGNSIETEPLLNATFSSEINYVVQIIATDTMGKTTISTIQVPSAKVYMHRPAGGTGMGLGGYVQEKDLLDVYWNVRFRKSLTIGEQTMANFVIEEGTDGIWKYRKWSDGTAECWGAHEQTDLEIKTAWGNLYESAGFTVALPSGLFQETPQFQITLVGSNGVMLQIYSEGTAEKSPHICAVRSSAFTISKLTTSITARGTWKSSEENKEEY